MPKTIDTDETDFNVSRARQGFSRCLREKQLAGKRNVLGANGFRHHTHRRVFAPNRSVEKLLKACVLYKRAPALSIAALSRALLVLRGSGKTKSRFCHVSLWLVESQRSFFVIVHQMKRFKTEGLATLKVLRSILFLFFAIFAQATVLEVAAQSTNQELPTPVFSNEINGTIRVLDLGDSRSTRHYYAFEATPGDLIVTVNSRNLNGDVDVFTAVTFRPLTKITIYAGTIPPEVTKSLYFRTRQILILRVEARSPNDDPGTYRITLGGSFQPFTGGIPVAENAPAATEPDKRADNNLERLSSVGATIPKPPGEVVEEPKPAETEVEKPAEVKPVTPAPSARRNTPRTTSRRNPRGRTPPRTTRTTPPKTEAAKTETEPPKTEEEKPPAADARKTEEKPATEKPQETPAGARLIIEQTDGTRIDRPMSTVRRIIVETNVIVIVLKTGRTERIPMSSVARMAIEPQ